MTTKIQEYQQAKAVASRIRQAVNRTLGLKDDCVTPDPQNDKHCFSVQYLKLSPEQWSPMVFHIECAHGYYGSSSGYSNTSDELGKYLAASMKRHASVLLEFASKLADDDAEKARKAAEEEARAVLKETA